MSEIKETKKKAAPKKTAAKKETVKKETAKKTTTKKASTTTKKTTTTKKASVKKTVKSVEEKVVVPEEVKVEPAVEVTIPAVEEPVASEPVMESSEPQVEIEIPQVVSEPVVSEPIAEEQPVYEEPVVQVAEPTIETPDMPTFEPLPPVEEGYRARPISEIMANTQEEPVAESYTEPQVEVESTYEEPIVSTEPEPIVFDTTPEEESSQQVETTYEPEQPVYEEMPSMEPTLSNNNVEPTVAVVKPKKKMETRTILLILLFVLLFAFIMFMPQIQDAINSIKKNTGMSEIERKAKEIEKKQNEENKTPSTDDSKKEQYSKLTCTSTTTALEDYDRTVVETFEYNTKKEIMASSKKITYTFVAANASYENLKTQCNENSLKYVDKKGYEIACNYNETEVVMEDRFDLAVFSTIKDGTTIISANAKYKDKIDNIKTRLEALDYTCE